MRQFLRHALPQPAASVDVELRRLVNQSGWQLIARLPANDRRHLLHAARTAQQLRPDDPELLIAVLLHDVGKADDYARVRLLHRVLVVLLGRFSPVVLQRLAVAGAPRWRHGFYLALEHPRLGAELAQSIGCSRRTCWLIAHHHSPTATRDPAMRVLRQADHEA